MSDYNKTGGPAFPCADVRTGEMGMTKREWYAGQALPGIIAKGNINFTDACEVAFMFADQMLRESQK